MLHSLMCTEDSRYIVQRTGILSVYEVYCRCLTRIADLLGPQLVQKPEYPEAAVIPVYKGSLEYACPQVYVPLLLRSECTRHSRWLGGLKRNRARDVGYELGVLFHYLPTLIGRCKAIHRDRRLCSQSDSEEEKVRNSNNQ